MQHQSLFVFDIETIPDSEVVKNLLDIESNDVNECRKALEEYHLKLTDGKNGFLRQPFWRVVAISFLEAQIIRDGNQENYVLKDIRSGGNFSSSEEDLVKGFFAHLKKSPPRLISFNGRTFDLPVLKYRAIKYGISAPWLYKSGDKWNNYTSRYSLDWHCDLLEAFSDFGTSARVKMNELCAVFNLPGKIGIDGSKVTEYYDAGKIEEIRNYCETDVINTYLLYLCYQHHNGSLSTSSYHQAKQDLVSYLKNSSKNYLQEFLNQWKKVDLGI